jgi:hypothetical protein
MVTLKTKEFTKLIISNFKNGTLEPGLLENFAGIFTLLEPHEKLLLLTQDLEFYRELSKLLHLLENHPKEPSKTNP